MATTSIGGSISNALGNLWGGNTTATSAQMAQQLYQQGLAQQQTYPMWQMGAGSMSSIPGVSGTPYPYQASATSTTTTPMWISQEDLDKMKKEVLEEVECLLSRFKEEIIKAVGEMIITVPTDEIRKALGDAQQ